MKHHLLSLCFVLCSALALPLWAEPDDCMTELEAKTLAQQLQNEGYIFYFPDCGQQELIKSRLQESISKQYIGADVGDGVLLHIRAARVVPCRNDDRFYSVEIEAQATDMSFVAFLDEAGKIKHVDLAQTAHEPEEYQPFVVTLNYHWLLTNSGKPQRLGSSIRSSYPVVQCLGLYRFPNENEGSPAYDEWYLQRLKP